MEKGKDLAKNTAIISIGKLCTQCISFFLLPLYTAVLNTSEYGTVDLMISYSSLLLPIATMAIEQALFRYLIDVRSKNTEKSVLISTSIIFAFIQGIAISILFIFVQFIINNEYVPLLYANVIASMGSAIMLQICRGVGDNTGYSLGSFISAVSQVSGNVLFLLVFGMGPHGMLLAAVLGNLICAIFLFVRNQVWSYIDYRSFRKATLRDLLRYSIPLVPNQLSWWTLNAADKTIVAVFLGTASNGLLAVAHKFPNIYIQFSNIFSVAWTESVALHIKDDDATSFFSQTVSTVFKLFASICFGMIACLPFVFPILIKNDYIGAYNLIPIFMVATLCNVVVSLYGAIYVAYKKSGEIAKTAIYAAVINVIVHLLLVKQCGLFAAAISSLVGYGSMAVYRYFHSRKYIIVKISGKVCVEGLVMMIVSLFSYYSHNNVVHVICLVFITLFACAINWSVLMNGLSMATHYLNKVTKKH